MDDKREMLAAYAHNAWAGWMEYMLRKGGTFTALDVEGNTCWVMSDQSYRRWLRQMSTPYADLPESEKESDRAEADKMLAIMGSR